MQLKHDLLVQLGSINNKDYIFQCSLCCFDCGNKEKRFLITNNPLHALLTDYFVHIVGALQWFTCSGLQWLFIFADGNENFFTYGFVRRIFLV